MSDQKHTQGPWFAVQYANYWSIQREDGYSPSNVLDEDKYPNAEANARLAAAAPDLLQAVEILVAGLKKNKDMYSDKEKISIGEEALRKAKTQYS